MSRYNYTTSKPDDARISINDGVETYFVSELELPEEFSMKHVAEDFMGGYDHGESVDWSCCKMEDLLDGDTRRFAFNKSGSFRWNLTSEALNQLR